MNIFVILPHQLFDKKYLPPKNIEIVIWEHPHYFKSYNYNKKKLILHRASMKSYYDYLKSFYKVKYINFNEKFTHKEYFLFDPIDKIKLPGKYKFLNSPNFLLTDEDIKKYNKKTDKFFFNSFYMWSKNNLNIYPKLKSTDKENRKSLPNNINIPKTNFTKTNKYINEAIQYINKYFKTNYGNTDNFNYPINHIQAKEWLNKFIKHKFKKFGDYQDALDTDNSYLFHSVLSSSINIGLINPIDIIEKISKVSKIPINSFEAYLRQLFWREYQRYCYVFYNFKNKNYLGNTKKLNKDWYDGTLGIPPVDNCINRGFDKGYLNHIERLMVVGNFMNLNEIHPLEGFRWFMEFSCDSYEWVMHQNVLDMVFFVSGGETMRRPYISSSNYILKMSNYKKGEWSEIWDDLYRKYIDKRKKKFYKFRYYVKI